MNISPLLALLPAAVLLYIVYRDLRDLRIPDWSVGLLFLLFAVGQAPDLWAVPLAWRVVVALAVFGICFVLFAAHLLCGGDVKLLPVVLLYVPAERLAWYFLTLSVCVIVTFSVIRLVRRADLNWQWRGLSDNARYPLGPAIALAALVYTFLGQTVETILAG